WRWVHTTTSIESGGKPAATMSSRNEVSRSFQPGLARGLWLPTQVSTAMRVPSMSTTRHWMRCTRYPLSSTKWAASHGVRPARVRTAAWLNPPPTRTRGEVTASTSTTGVIVALPTRQPVMPGTLTAQDGSGRSGGGDRPGAHLGHVGIGEGAIGRLEPQAVGEAAGAGRDARAPVHVE